MSASQPIFIVVEGMDGAGKSTAARALAERLGGVCMTTPSAGLRPVRRAVDAQLSGSPIATQLWYAATVVERSEAARAALRSGQPVVMDRYWMSTLAYAKVRGDHLRLDDVGRRLLAPDLTLFLRVDSSTREHRLRSRDGEALPHDLASLRDHQLLEREFMALRNHPIAGRLVVVDASGGIEATRTACWNAAAKELNARRRLATGS